MEGTDLTEADLEGAVFEGAVLRGASLVQASAADAVFTESDLSAALLRDGTFDGADFTGAVLDDVDARDASFVSAEFGGVRALRCYELSGPIFEQWPLKTAWKGKADKETQVLDRVPGHRRVEHHGPPRGEGRRVGVHEGGDLRHVPQDGRRDLLVLVPDLP
jgi:hypothetical protein